MSDKNLVTFGDSVTWGQGHLEQNKFAHLVAHSLALQLKMDAHSGATIGVGDTQTGHCGPEAPNHYPTILQQLNAAKDNPDEASVVIVTGGINDVSVQTILSPFTTDKQLRHVTKRYCHDDMLVLLQAVLARYRSPKTKIVVTSYFPVFSTKSDFGKVIHYLPAIGIAPPPSFLTEKERLSFVLRSVELALLFWQESRANLRSAVNETGVARVLFADVPFQEDNAMFAPTPWLFNVHLDSATHRLVPEDDVVAARHEQCRLCHLNDPLGVATCDIASAGHPNVAGEHQFADTILHVLK
jgi:hypothetical protein